MCSFCGAMSLQSLQSEIAALQRRVQALQLPVSSAKTARNRRKRQRRRAKQAGAAAGGVPVAPMTQAPVQGAGGGRRRRARGGGGGIPTISNGQGAVRVRRTEFALEVSGGTAVQGFYFRAEDFPWLGNLAKSFDRITWHSATVCWKPAVGTTVDGLVSYGMDWAGDRQVTKRSDLLAFTPVQDHPVWQQSQMVLPSARLQTRKEYVTKQNDSVSNRPFYDSSPGLLTVVTTNTAAKVMGEIWITYDVTLFGTQ